MGNDKEHQSRVIESTLEMLKDPFMSGKPEQTGMAIMSTLTAWMYSKGVSPEEILKMHRVQSQTVVFGLMGGEEKKP
jgi:hypothetical protein